MADKPELPKFDLNNIINSFKSLINPESGTPEVNPNDALGLKIAQISVLAQEIAKQQVQQAEEYARLNQLLNGLFTDIENLRKMYNIPLAGSETTTTTEAKPTKSKTTQKTVEPESTITEQKKEKE